MPAWGYLIARAKVVPSYRAQHTLIFAIFPRL